VVEEVGYARLTVAMVIARARVSRKTFYDLYASREDCFLAVFEQAIERAARSACASYAEQSSWRASMRAALEAVLVLMEQERGMARLCVVETLAGGPLILAFRTELMREIARVIDAGRREPGALRSPPAITAEAVVGGVFSVLAKRLCAEREEPLAELVSELMSMITLPYLGARAATQELNKPSRERPRDGDGRALVADADPLHGLSIRLTHRTVCTLIAIAERPGASNRQIALAAGMADEGQVSKLLSRLARLELVENVGAGHTRGAANAWHLSERGEQLVRQRARAEQGDGAL
jgi:AcrR family transcriptional regulator